MLWTGGPDAWEVVCRNLGAESHLVDNGHRVQDLLRRRAERFHAQALHVQDDVLGDDGPAWGSRSKITSVMC